MLHSKRQPVHIQKLTVKFSSQSTDGGRATNNTGILDVGVEQKIKFFVDVQVVKVDSDVGVQKLKCDNSSITAIQRCGTPK